MQRVRRQIYRMKIKNLIAGMALLSAITLTACGGSSSTSTSGNCLVFGEVPALYSGYQTERDKIEESATKSGGDYKKASADIDELKASYRAKIEAAGKQLDGKPIEIAPSEDFKVVSPVSISFKEIANNVNAVFSVAGDIETARDVTIDVTEAWLKSHDVTYLYLPLMLSGCDGEGLEVTSCRIGYFKGLTVVDGKVILPQGVKAVLQTVAYNRNQYEDWIKVKSVKLTLDTSRL